MPQKAPQHGRTPIRVDSFNNFYKLDTVTGAYVPIPSPTFAKRIAVSHVQTYVFETDATVAIDSGVPGANGREHVKAKKGDMLLIWSNGQHKIIPPKAQRWILEALPTATAAGDNPPPDIPPGPDLAKKKR